MITLRTLRYWACRPLRQRGRIMPRTTPPFRADHVGSLLRPQRAAAGPRGPRGGSDLGRRAEGDRGRRRSATSCGCRRKSGLQSATDGEFRRASWHMDFIYELEGISKAEDDLVVRFHNPDGDIEFTPAALKVDGRIGLSKPTFGERLRVPQGHGRRRDAEAHDPVAEHGPLPRRRRGDRPGGLPRQGRVLERPDRRLREPGADGRRSSAAPTCSSTTRASPTSTTPTSAR